MNEKSRCKLGFSQFRLLVEKCFGIHSKILDLLFVGPQCVYSVLFNDSENVLLKRCRWLMCDGRLSEFDFHDHQKIFIYT